MKNGGLVVVRMLRRMGLSASALKGKANLFYVLAFLPILPFGYYKYIFGYSILGVLIPVYGFLLLFFKRERLLLFPDAEKGQRFAGFAAVLASFFLYSLLILYYPSAFYWAGTVFYAIYILGLFLVFHAVSALRESLSVVFLVVAGGSSFYIGELLEHFMQPLVPYFVQMMTVVLVLLGIPATVENPTVIVLDPSGSAVCVLFEAGCIGIHSFLIFSVIIAVTMMEESASTRTKLLWSVGGVVCTFFVNIVRVSLIAVVIYYFGYDNWGEVHSWIGYALFLLWLAFFFIMFSSREAIQNKIRAFRQRF
ncbi:MAG: exosortase/archaeosortase family protein [Candidatus Bathyarchaeota archaeon]|nr:MAG: exosortase/archaeosortase family protein [Candidatus Bathyarchaeota archaeon]